MQSDTASTARSPVEQVLAIWQRMDSRRRVALVAAVAATLLAVGLLAAFGARAEYRLLYAGLEPGEAGMVLEKLRELKVDAKVEADAIYVPAGQVYEARLDLAAAGLPRGGSSGFELFDKTSFGMSDFAEKVTFLRSLQGELSRTISGLEPVERAAVHIVVPKPTVFRSAPRKGSASVVVHLRPGCSLSPRQVSGITHLVAAAVEGLETDSVSVLDQQGNVLGAPQPDGSQLGASSHLEARERVERYLADKAQTMLDAALGAGHAFVRVSAELDRTRSERRTERFDPEGQVARVEKIVSRQLTRAGEGGAGATANVGPSGGGAGDSPFSGGTQGESEAEENVETTYEIGRHVEVLTKEAGALSRLAVAVVLDQQSEAVSDRIERVVKQAVGFDSGRGDTFELAALELASGEDAELEAALLASERWRTVIELVKHGSAAVVAVAVAVILGLLVLRAVPKRPDRGRSGQPRHHGAPGRRAAEEEEEALDPATLSLELRRELTEAVRAAPRESAEVVAGWLHAEDEGGAARP